MQAMCVKCFNATNTPDNFTEEQKKNRPGYSVGSCPECSGWMVEIDELILPTIIELNKKGWTTDFCCSGHLGQPLNFLGTYISFTDDVAPPTVPTDFHINPDNGAMYLDEEKHFGSGGIEGFKQLFELNLSLYEWALSLPENDGYNQFVPEEKEPKEEKPAMFYAAELEDLVDTDGLTEAFLRNEDNLKVIYHQDNMYFPVNSADLGEFEGEPVMFLSYDYDHDEVMRKYQESNLQESTS